MALPLTGINYISDTGGISGSTLSSPSSPSRGTGKKKLLDASFRGAVFQIESVDDQIGRRSVLHEFPLKDLPYVEDLGAASRQIDITGFVGGKNWQSERDALIAALKEEGPGKLVHPWFGELVVCQNSPAKITHKNNPSMLVTFTLSFIEAEEPQNPSSTLNSGSLVFNGADSALQSATDFFNNSLSSVLGKDKLSAVESLLPAVRGLAGEVNGVQNGDYLGAAGFIGNLLGLDVSAFATMLPGVNKLADFLSPLFSSWQGRESPYAAHENKNMGNIASQFFASSAAIPPPQSLNMLSVVKKTEAGVQNATYQYAREAFAIEGCRAAAFVVPKSRAETKVLYKKIVAAADSVIFTTQNNSLSALMVDLRTAALTSLTKNSTGLPDVVVFEERTILPSLQIAFARSVRESKQPQELIVIDNDFIVRNGIFHPGFCPAGQNMEILRYAKV